MFVNSVICDITTVIVNSVSCDVNTVLDELMISNIT